MGSFWCLGWNVVSRVGEKHAEAWPRLSDALQIFLVRCAGLTCCCCFIGDFGVGPCL